MILIIGGAGYIGSHITAELITENHRVVVLDNLSTGHRASIHRKAILEKGDVRNADDLDRVFSRYSIDAVIYAAHQEVDGVMSVLQKMVEYRIHNFIFSASLHRSSMSYKGQLEEVYIPYPVVFQGDSSIVIEQVLEDFYKAYDIRYVSLRCGSVVGANIDEGIGEGSLLKRDLVARMLLHVRDFVSTPFWISREEYMQKREYIHVIDVAKAHVLAMFNLLCGKRKNDRYNVTMGMAFSFRELAKVCEDITGKSLNISYNNLMFHKGHVHNLFSHNIHSDLGWYPSYSLKEAIYSAWLWYTQFPNGYEAKEFVYK